MRQLFFRIVLAFIGILVLLAIVGALLPRDFSVTAEIKIKAPVSLVFEQINDLKNWQQWAGWNSRDIPDLKIEYGNKTTGTGASQRWTDARGDGRLWITDSQPNSSIDYELDFLGFSEMKSRIELKEAGEAGTQTALVWQSDGRLPAGPFYGWFGFLFEAGLQAEYQKNLEKLKALAEKAVKRRAKGEQKKQE